MGLELRRSSVPRSAVERVTNISVGIFEKTQGRPATSRERENIRKDVVKGAEQLNRDRRVK